MLRGLRELDFGPVRLINASPLLETAPFGRKNQPEFVNAVAAVETHLSPDALMRRLHMIERRAGRQRGLRWGPRTLDLDLLCYHDVVRRRSFSLRPLALPHPGISERTFVLAPIVAIAPGWRHPVTHERASVTLRKLYT